MDASGETKMIICKQHHNNPVCHAGMIERGLCRCFNQQQEEYTKANPLPKTGPETKSVNPKDIAATNKLTASILPPIGLVHCAAVMRNGASKYGVANWRDEPIKRSVYDDAIERHRLKYMAGELIDKDSKLPHLAHIATNCLILLDAEFNGVLTEDGYYHNNGQLVTEAIDNLDKGKSNAE